MRAKNRRPITRRPITRRPITAQFIAAQGFTLIEVIVALSLLSLGVAGVAQLRHSAFRHLALTQEIQEATYLADSHLNTLGLEGEVVIGVQTGEYSRGLGLEIYPWELSLLPLNDDVLQPQSASLSKKVRSLKADLSVWVDHGARELRFHTLLLVEPLNSDQRSRPSVELGASN